MPDRKLTDNEIVKGLKWTADKIRGAERIIIYKKDIEKFYNNLMNALDLINRLQAKVIKEQNKNSKLRNERNRLQAQNKDLAETVHNLIIEKDALFDKAEELKAEIERLKTNLNVELENFATEYDNKIKAEAYKEFAERLKKQVYKVYKGGIHPTVEDEFIYEIDNLLKEMVGEDNA